MGRRMLRAMSALMDVQEAEGVPADAAFYEAFRMVLSASEEEINDMALSDMARKAALTLVPVKRAG